MDQKPTESSDADRQNIDRAPPSRPSTPKELLSSTVSEALADTKERLLRIWRLLPLWLQLGVIVLVASCIAVWHYKEFVLHHWNVIRMMPRIALGSSRRVELPRASRQALQDAIATLQRDAASDLALSAHYPTIVSYEAWPAAQTIVSSRLPRPEVLAAIARQEKAACSCWPQYRDMPPNIAATAWVLRAYAFAKKNPGDAEVRFLLTRQLDGAWPLYDGTRDRSTFATALAILALYDLLHAHILPPALSSDAEVSLNQGITFLRTSNIENRWRYYPERSDSAVSDADSGLAIYTLHYVGAGDASLDRLWLDSLPSENLSSRDDEMSNIHWLFHSDEFQPPVPDSIRHIRLPWLIAGTVSAYPSGTILQRAKASAFLENIFESSSTTAFVPPENYKRAELLIALRYLLEQSENNRLLATKRYNE